MVKTNKRELIINLTRQMTMQFYRHCMAAHNVLNTTLPWSRFLAILHTYTTVGSVTPSAIHHSSLTKCHETFVHVTASHHLTQTHDFCSKSTSVLPP